MKQLLILLCVIGLFSCTQNQMARQFGGEITIDLPQGNKLVNATWKQNNLWYLTTKMDTNDVPEISYFTEQSSFGIVEGVVIFKESK